MRIARTITIVGLMLACCDHAVLASTYESFNPGRAENYGITYSGFENAAVTEVNTQTRHHRFGQQTGIGSSTFQTESATVESMPTVNYTPTAVSPAVVPTARRQPFERVNLFSQDMLTTPALRPMSAQTETGYQLFLHRPMFGSLDQLRLIPSRSGDVFHLGEPGRGRPRGRYLDLQLTDPFGALDRTP